MYKRFISFLLVFIITLALLPQLNIFASAEGYFGNCGVNGDNLIWSFDPSTNELTISGNGLMADYGSGDSQAAPWKNYRDTIESISISEGVLSIGATAFYSCYEVKSVSIPESITSIGSLAFCDCGKLESFSLPSHLTEIRNSTFTNCASIKTMDIPDGVIRIGDGAFAGCRNMYYVQIPTSVEVIGAGAFASCESLKNAIIPNSVVSIGSNLFGFCYDLETVSIGDGITQIPDYMFNNCHSLKAVSMPNSILSISQHAFYQCNSLESIALPEQLTEIKDLAFYGCSSLKKIVIPDSTRSIGSQSFRSCTELLSLTIGSSVETIGSFAFQGAGIEHLAIPASVTNIGDRAFNSCRNLLTIDVDPLNCYYSSINGALVKLDDKEIIQAPCGDTGNYSVPHGIEIIGDFSFQESSFSNITIADQVETINGYAFYDCKNLEKAVVGPNVSFIGGYAFSTTNPQTNITHLFILNPSCSINQNSMTLGRKETTVINGYTGSTAEDYAKKYGYKFVPLTSDVVNWVTSNLYSLTGELSITVFGNKAECMSPDENSVLLKEATVNYNSSSYQTDPDGHVQLKYDGGFVVVSKSGYVTRTFTEAALKRSTTIVLQKESDYPVISGLWMDDLDILHEDAEVSLTGKTQYSLSTEIEWGSSAEASVKLMQGGNVLEIIGGTATFAWSDYFDLSEPIYLVATNADGLTSKKKLKISAESQLPESLSGLSIEFGDSLSFTLPDSVPDFFQGTELSAGIYSNIPIEYTVEDGKVYAAIGFQKDYSRSDGKWKAKTFVKSLQDVFKDAAEGLDDYHLYQSAQKAVGGLVSKVEGSFGIQTGYKIMGYAEGYLTPEGTVVWLDSGLIIGGNASVGYSFPFYLGPVPMFFEAKLAGSVEAKANLYIAPEAKQFTPNVSLSGEVSLSAGLGVGIKDVASVSGGLKGSLNPRWDMSLGRTDFFQLKAKLKAYAKVAVLFFEYSKDWNLAESVWYEYPEKRLPQFGQTDEGDFEPYNIENYRKQDFSYLTNGSPFRANNLAVRGGEQSVWLSNSYTHASPQLASFSDGTMLAVWIGMDETGTANGLRLFASFYNGETWSEPWQIDQDDTMDAVPSLTVINDVAYLTWQNASDDVSEVDSLDVLAGMMDISVAVFDKANQHFNIERITHGNGMLELSPVVCGEGNTIFVVWQRNEGNEWFSTEGNEIVYRCCNDGVWEDEVIAYSSLPLIVSVDADFTGAEFTIAYSVDTDGSLNTTDDLEVYENGTKLTENNGVDSGVQYFQHTLYWYQSGSIVTKEATVLENVPTDRFQIVSDGGLTSIVYAEQDGLYSTLYAAYYDDASGKYGTPIALTDGLTNVASFSAAAANNSVCVLWNSENVAGDFSSEKPYGTSNIRITMSEAVCDLSVVDIYYDCSEFVDNADMSALLTVHNFGEVAADGVTIIIADADGNELNKLNYEDIVLSGSTVEISCGFQASQEQYGKDIAFTVLPLRKVDANPEDNSITANMSFRDITVENMAYGFNESGALVVFADVVNRSYENTTEAITVGLYKDSLDSTPLDTMTINGLDSLGLQHTAFTVDTHSTTAVYYIAISVEDDNEKRGNDSDYVFVTNESHDDPKPNPFEDVAESKYYYTPVLWAYYHNPQITSGTSDTTFSPNATCTRAQIVTFLWRAAGSPEPTTINNPFDDVKSDKYYYKAVLWAAETGVTSGTSDTTFSPNASCTRSQVVTFLWRFAGSPDPTTAANPFTDVPDGKYYTKAVLWAAEKGVTAGTSDTTFSPNQTCTRGQIVTFLYRYMES